MKNKAWLLKLPLVILFSSAFYITYLGEDGNLNNQFVRDRIYPQLRSITGFFTNLKFRLRGNTIPKNKILIIDIDEESLANEALGRWPWHRDKIAALVENALVKGVKTIGLDAVFSEPDRRVPDTLMQALEAQKLGDLARSVETDPVLSQVIQRYRDRIVLGWTSANNCQPAYSSERDCPVASPDMVSTVPAHFKKFAVSRFEETPGYNATKTPLLTDFLLIPNLPIFGEAALHAGNFDVIPDPDGYIRRKELIAMVNGIPQPSLPLEMARVALNDSLFVKLDDKYRIKTMGFEKLNRSLRTTPLGVMDINFRGPSFSFPYVSAVSLLDSDHTANIVYHGTTLPFPCKSCKLVTAGPDGVSFFSGDEKEILADSYALLGVSAKGAYDMRAFPFDSNTPGVEGHATILDNLLSDDYLTPSTYGNSWIWILLAMTIGAIAFSIAIQKMEAVAALLTFVISAGVFAYLDQKILFEKYLMNWKTGFLYLEYLSIFFFTLAIKYVAEERNKKFIKGAFSKYVAPAIVDSILKDPTKLTVGGERRDLTILFSDIRGFTTLSEKMDAKALSSFLNDYLGLMTDLVFDHEGTLDKYIGDAVMAFWGAPLDQPKHALNSCKAAVSMMQTLAANRERFMTQYGVELNVGVGINSGAVSVGNMGSSRIFEYTVIGDHVNLASRTEGLTKHYGVQILTTRFTFDAIAAGGDPLPPHRVLDQVKVKGKKNAIELIQILEREYSAEGLLFFNEAYQFYLKKEWDQAISKFKAANELLRTATQQADGPSEMFIERCEEFRTNPPNADWDGSWEMTSK